VRLYWKQAHVSKRPCNSDDHQTQSFLGIESEGTMLEKKIIISSRTKFEILRIVTFSHLFILQGDI